MSFFFYTIMSLSIYLSNKGMCVCVLLCFTYQALWTYTVFESSCALPVLSSEDIAAL